MRKRLLNGVNMKIAAATSVVIFTLLVSFVGVFAWFQAVTEANNATDPFVISNANASISSINIYRLDSIDNDSYKFDNTNPIEATVNPQTGTATLPSGIINLGTYLPDAPNHPILMLIGVTGSSLTISASTTNQNAEYITDLQGTPSGNRNPMSSVVQFHSVGFSKNTQDSTSKESRTVNNKISILKTELTDKNSSSFVKITNGSKTGFSKKIIISDDPVDSLAYIGIVIDFYPESVQFIYSTYMGTNIDQSPLGFVCDWGMAL